MSLLTIKPIPVLPVGSTESGIVFDKPKLRNFKITGSQHIIGDTCPLNGLPAPGLQFYGGYNPYPEDFDYQSQGLIGYRGDVITLKKPGSDLSWKASHPAVYFKNKLSGTRYSVDNGARNYSGSNTQILSSFLPSMYRTRVGSQYFGNVNLGAAFECNPSFDNSIRETLLKAESDLFFKSLDRTKIANVGSTLAEVSSLRNIFTRGVSTFLKLPGNLASDLSLSSLIGSLEALASWWLTYSFELKPLVSTGSELFQNAGKRTLAGSTFRLTSPIEQIDLLTHYETINGQKVVWGGSIPDSPCTSPLAYTDGGGILSTTICDGDEVYRYESGSVGSGAPSSSSFSCSVAAKLRMSWQVTTDPAFLALQLGLLPNAMYWEIIPFSFVIDWFAKVGEFLTKVDEIQSNTYVVTGANYSLTLLYKITSDWGGAGESELQFRSSSTQPNGEIGNGIGEFFPTPSNLIYLPSGIKDGSLVSKVDARLLNAVSLLTVLIPLVLRGKHVASSLPFSSVERSRIFLALQKLGL